MNRPLSGRRVVVTRPASSSAELVDRLAVLGADVVSAPLIDSTGPPNNGSDLLTALRSMAPADYLVVTSAKGVNAVVGTGVDVGAFRTAAVGTATAAALVRAGFREAVVPDTQLASELAKMLVQRVGGRAVFPDGSGRTELVLNEATPRAILAVADNAGTDLEDILRSSGWTVQRCVAYRTFNVRPPQCVIEAACQAEVVLFTSGSAVQGWIDAGGSPESNAITIGPTTTAAAKSLDQRVVGEAATHDLDGLCRSVVEFLVPESSARS